MIGMVVYVKTPAAVMTGCVARLYQWQVLVNL
jgi:hypothetical protein